MKKKNEVIVDSGESGGALKVQKKKKVKSLTPRRDVLKWVILGVVAFIIVSNLTIVLYESISGYTGRQKFSNSTYQASAREVVPVENNPVKEKVTPQKKHTPVKSSTAEKKVEKKEEVKKNPEVAYFDQLKARSNVHTTKSGLMYEIVKEGNGEKPKETSSVTIDYKMNLYNKSDIVDSGTSEFKLNDLISGLKEGLQLMKNGAEYIFHIPSKLAYAKGTGSIPANTPLVFRVKLLKNEEEEKRLAFQSKVDNIKNSYSDEKESEFIVGTSTKENNYKIGQQVDGGTVYHVNSDGTARVYKILNNWAGKNYQGAVSLCKSNGSGWKMVDEDNIKLIAKSFNSKLGISAWLANGDCYDPNNKAVKCNVQHGSSLLVVAIKDVN